MSATNSNVCTHPSDFVGFARYENGNPVYECGQCGALLFPEPHDPPRYRSGNSEAINDTPPIEPHEHLIGHEDDGSTTIMLVGRKPTEWISADAEDFEPLPHNPFRSQPRP